MPIRICPNCNNKQPIWNILNARCSNCGYSIIDIVEKPSDKQKKKIFKHRTGSKGISQENWIFNIDEKEVITQLAAHGSTTIGWGIVATFQENIGYKENEPSRKTKWVGLVLSGDPNNAHAFPIDPQRFEGEEWECINCGQIYTDECPLLCRNCGKHMWLR